MTFTLAEQIAEVKRELWFRDRTFERWVNEGKMRKQEADRRIALMTAVLATLEELQRNDLPELPGLSLRGD